MQMISGGLHWAWMALKRVRTWARRTFEWVAEFLRRLPPRSKATGDLMLTPEQQTAFVAELPGVFVPIAGGWARMGMTHIRLSAANEDVLAGALRTAWQLRVEKNRKKRR